MPRVYTVSFSSVSVTAQQDLFEITPADDKPVRILGLVLGQHSDVGDSNAESYAITLWRGWASSGSGGSSATPRPVDPSSTAAGFGAETNNTSLAGSATEVLLFADVWNGLSGYQIWFPEQTAIESRTEITSVRLAASTAGANPADAITVSGTLWVEEL